MPVYGDLRTFSLTDLLRWASMNKKTGVLEVERNAISRRVEFRKGWVGSCSSNDPSALLGQYLLSHGRVDQTQLQHLLTLQRVIDKRLGLLVVEMGVLTRHEMANVVAAKARETVHSLFDWDDAYFRFVEGASLDPDQIEVNLSAEELIDEGRKRSRLLKRIRQSFESSGIVLTRTERDVPADLLEGPVTRGIFDAVDGRRTIAEILLHARASEFLVLRFLHSLFERGLLSIAEVCATSPDNPTLLDTRREMTARPLDAPLAPNEVDRALAEMEPSQSTTEEGLDVQIDAALKFLEQRQFETAVELLRSTCRQHASEYVRRLLLRAETSFVSSIRADESFTSRVPVLRQDRHMLLGQDLAPEESFVLSLVDGSTDVQSVLWLAPLREVDTLMTLRRLARKSMIQLADESEVQSLAGSLSF